MENLGQLDGLREQNNEDLVSSPNVIYLLTFCCPRHCAHRKLEPYVQHFGRVLLVGATYCTYIASQFRLNSAFSH